MSKGNTFENDLLKLIFNAAPIANLADNASSSPASNLYISLHSADPGETGTQSTSEVAYTGYARVAVPRSAAGWTVTGNVASPTNPIIFPQCTGGSASATHFAIGTAGSGAGKILYKGTLTPAISISQNVEPKLDTTTTITEE